MQLIEMPDFWESLLQGYVKKTFYAASRRRHFADREGFTEGDYRFFVKGICKLSESFTRERASLPKNYLNQKELRSGYILYFLPINALKVATLLSQRTLSKMESETCRLHILDIGSGPGTGLFGTMLWLERSLRKNCRKLELKWTLVDQNGQALQDATNLYPALLEHLRKSHPNCEIVSELKTIRADFFSGRISKRLSQQIVGGGIDLALGLNVLGEMSRDSRLHLVKDLVQNLLVPKGKILLMEPALRLTTRDLMRLHDEIVEDDIAAILAPCLHQSNCPMLQANARDWCHTYIPWERPPWIEKLDRLAEIRKEYLKCSYLLLGKEEPPPTPKDLWRVVSGPLNSKGKSERLLCGPGGLPGLLRIMRLDRDQTEKNREFDRLERGDIVELPKTPRINRETVIKKI